MLFLLQESRTHLQLKAPVRRGLKEERSGDILVQVIRKSAVTLIGRLELLFSAPRSKVPNKV